MAQSLHMREAHGNDKNYDFYWGEQWDEYNQYAKAGLHKTAIVSTILGWRKAMATKGTCAHLANRIEEQSHTGLTRPGVSYEADSTWGGKARSSATVHSRACAGSRTRTRRRSSGFSRRQSSIRSASR